MEKVMSHSDFLSKLSKDGKTYLLLFKTDSELSNCAYQNIDNVVKGKSELSVYTADVSIVKDIHQNYGINSVPALLVFAGGKLNNIIKGCQEVSYYKAVTESSIFQIKEKSDGKVMKQVTVYSTPTCSWCNTLKAWLGKNKIAYKDVDVSQDQNAAESLVRRSGQQGVPQTEINGQIVVGFNQQRLKELLEIQ